MRLLSGILILASMVLAATPPAPKTRVDRVPETLHGVTLNDPYRWLEDQDSAETRAWIGEQNRHTRSVLDAIPGRDALRQRLGELMRVDAVDLPVARGTRYVLARRLANQNKPVLVVRDGVRAVDCVLIDPNTMQGMSVQVLDVSRDGKTLAYGLRKGGEDETTVAFLNLDTGQHLKDTLPRGRWIIRLLPDGSGFYYRLMNKDGHRANFHKMGSSGEDPYVFGKGVGTDKFVNLHLSEDGSWLLIAVAYGAGDSRSELYFQDIRGKGPITPLVTDVAASFQPRFAGTRLFLQTNWKAPNGRILEVDLKQPAREKWREVVPESQWPVRGFTAAGGKLAVSYLENAVPRIKLFHADGKLLREIGMPTLGSALVAPAQWDRGELFYSFVSYGYPMTIFRYDVATGQQDVFSRISVPVDGDSIEVWQVWYESRDKTRIPMFVAAKKGLALDGKRPVYLTGYGGFNLTQTPAFSASAALWIERGGVWAVPNLRGGGEFGEKWHEAGMFERKQNVFDDFIAAAEWLIANRYTNPGKLAIAGSSNGGLLVGAAMTQRPDLFGAVLCGYPLLDMIRYQRFLIAKLWVSEYGSSEDPTQFGYIRKYSPYHNVEHGKKYPATMIVSGDSDTRVAPLHARKMAALLQSALGSGKPVLLHYDTTAGHSQGKPVSQAIEDATDSLTFLLHQLGELR